MILSYTQVKSVLYNAGFRGVNLEPAIKICYCESLFDTNAHNTMGEDSRGLMQINVNAHPQYENLNLFQPDTNARVAYEIFTKRGNFYDWTCARNLGLVNPKQNYFGIALAFFAISLYVRIS